MHILHFLPSLRPEAGGPIRAVLDLSAAFAGRGHVVHIATTELSDDLRARHAQGDCDLTSGKAKIVLLDGPMAGTTPLTKRALVQAEELLAQSDLLHVHGVWNYSNVQLSKLARRLNKPYFVSVRGMLDDWCMEQKSFKKRLFLLACGRRHLEKSTAVHLTADFEFEQARKWFPRGTGVVIPNLLDLQPYRSLPGSELATQQFAALQVGEPVVLFLSRVHVKKGAEVLLQAAKLLHTTGDRAQFVLAGAGDDSYIAQLKESAATLGIADRVHFIGHVGGNLKVSLYQASLCLALPTHQENFGFVFPEAMAAGTPVITTKGVDIWPQLQRGGAMIVERTASAFAESIRSLIHNRDERAARATQARSFVFQEYDEDAIVRQFQAMYVTQRG
jgi:glycosyltransferase involved in cell wall biosynthesis